MEISEKNEARVERFHTKWNNLQYLSLIQGEISHS